MHRLLLKNNRMATELGRGDSPEKKKPWVYLEELAIISATGVFQLFPTLTVHPFVTLFAVLSPFQDCCNLSETLAVVHVHTCRGRAVCFFSWC